VYLVLERGWSPDHHGSDYERVDWDVSVVEHVVGASLDGGAHRAAEGGRVTDEAVGQLVADHRLGVVVEVGNQCLGRRDALRDRLVVGVDELDDARVTGEVDYITAGVAVPDQSVGGKRTG
jgi:hypothetical protein